MMIIFTRKNNATKRRERLIQFISLKQYISIVIIGLLISEPVFAEAYYWQRSRSPDPWYESPFAACADDIGLQPGESFFNPEVSTDGRLSPSSLVSPIFADCYATILSGAVDNAVPVRTYLGPIRGFRCSQLNVLTQLTPLGFSCVTKNDDTPSKDTGKSCNEVANPCNVSNGNKYQHEVDIVFSNIRFERSYNSQNLVNLGLGRGWRHNHQAHLIVNGDSIVHASKSGRGEPWTKIGEQWHGDSDSDLILEQNASGFQITYPNETLEQYDSLGRLISKVDSKDRQVIYEYSSELSFNLSKIIDHYGHTFEFLYHGDRLRSVTDPLGNIYQYFYDLNDNLISVKYPDVTSTGVTSTERFYHYEDQNLINHLTGITDENGDRYATWAYDDEGRAISSEHAQTTNQFGQEKVELDFQEGN